VYDFYYILYILTGLIAFGNTCLFIALVMSIEDKKTERKRPQQKKKKKNKAKPMKKKPVEDREVLDVFDDDDIIIEEPY
jgi:hypothetical protein